jgi:hypothetical protein
MAQGSALIAARDPVAEEKASRLQRFPGICVRKGVCPVAR